MVFARLAGHGDPSTFFDNTQDWSDVHELTRSAAATAALAGAAIAAVIAIRRQQSTEQSLELSRQAQVREDARAHADAISRLRDRFTTAAGQLGDESAHIRLAGAYAMAALADEWLSTDEQRAGAEAQVCINILCGYIRAQRDYAGSEAARRADVEVRQTIIRIMRDHLFLEARLWRHFDFDFTDAQFDGNFSFEGAEFAGGSISFAGAEFCGGDMNFNATAFLGPTTFERAAFVGIVDFGRALISGSTRFDSATFSGSASFDRATFSGDVTFFRAKFLGVVSFRQSHISGGSFILAEAEFPSDACVLFSGAQFSGGVVSFLAAGFSGGEVSFYETRFSCKEVDFFGAEFSAGVVSFRKADFSGGATSFIGANFSGGRVDFQEAIEGGRVVGPWGRAPLPVAWPRSSKSDGPLRMDDGR